MDTAGRIDYSTLLIRKVRAGGAFDIDYRVTDPNRHVIFNGIREKQGDLFFTAKYAGEYSFCFSNNMSAVTEKTVDFQISVSKTM